MAIERGDPAAQVDKDAAAAGCHLGVAEDEAVADGDKGRGGLEDVGRSVGVELVRAPLIHKQQGVAVGRARHLRSAPGDEQRLRAGVLLRDQAQGNGRTVAAPQGAVMVGAEVHDALGQGGEGAQAPLAR